MGEASSTHKSLNLAVLDDETTPEPTIILPGLPNDLALLCLARLPCGRHAHGRCVSRAWRLALQPSSIYALRRSLGITEECVFVCLSAVDSDLKGSPYAWLLLDPLLSCCNVIPPPPVRGYITGRYVRASDVQGVAAGKDVLVVGVNISRNRFEPLDESKIFCFDVLGRQWSVLAAGAPIDRDRRSFASAMVDEFLFVAGGHVPGGDPFKHLRSVERFNTRTRQLEMLPDMNEVRDRCTGFIMDGCFYVIGGFSRYDTTCHNSGEFFDPRTGVWTLVPNMWPKEMAAAGDPKASRKPSVAVVNGQLYALRMYSREIMRYEKLTNSWETMGYFPAAGESSGSPFGLHQIIGVGEELWVFRMDGQSDVSVIASKPTAGLEGDSLTWRLLPFKLQEGFTWTSTCVVLKV